MPHDDFQGEPTFGLPERLPDGEHILWQGRPDWWALTKDSLSFWWIAGYFGVLVAWRVITVSDLMPLGAAVISALPFAILGLIVCGLLMLFAWIQARLTVYTVTNARVAMRIGAALTLTLNIPFKQVANASLDLRKDGTGTIALETAKQTKISYLVCWPHVRPWTLGRPEPALRCIPEAEHVAELVADAAQARVSTPLHVVAGTAVAAE